MEDIIPKKGERIVELILRREKEEDLFKLTMWWPEGGVPPEELIRELCLRSYILEENLTIQENSVEIASPQANQLLILEAHLRHLMKRALRPERFLINTRDFPISTFELGEYRLSIKMSRGAPA